MLSQGFTSFQSLMLLTLEPIFTSAEKIFKKFSRIKEYAIYYVNYKTKVDKYGNDEKPQRKILMSLALSRGTADKINWKYVKNNLRSSIYLNNEEEIKRFTSMIDKYNGRTKGE